MKFFALILSLVVLWLTLTPCIDTPEDNCVSKTEMSQQHSHSGDLDLCSPFCTCQCCQVCVNIPSVLFTQVHSANPEFLYPVAHQDVPHDFNYELYKPPRG